jgi:polyferredoxin
LRPKLSQLAAASLTALILAVTLIKVPFPILLGDRFLPGSGPVQLLLLSIYAGWLTGKMIDPKQSRLWRLRIWRLFSAVFFIQLLLGLIGYDIFLMTGELHFPIPALILAGPLYRGGGMFMPILFSATIIFVGPAWCSHLCYIGSWDDAFCRTRNKPATQPVWLKHLRIIILIAVIATAVGLNRLGASAQLAAALAATFGIVGVLIMATISRARGSMVHCITYCPVGLIANIVGKINPFRIIIKDDCRDCGICTDHCRYDALTPEDVARRKPGLTCTLCGDCISSCRFGHLEYSFPGLSAQKARTFFLVLVIALHASFLGLARI